MTQIKNHTSESNNQSICKIHAQWNVIIQGEGNNMEFYAEGNGNTFGEALSNLYYNNLDCEWCGYNEQFPDLCITGDYTQGNEHYAFDFPINADSFATMAHYLFAKGNCDLTIEDLMAVCCTPTDFGHEYLPLSAFTAGTKYYEILKEAIPQPESQGRTKSRKQIFDQYFRVLHLITDRDKGLSTKIMRGRADRILEALYRYKDKLESTQRYKDLHRLYETKLLSWADLQNMQFTKEEYFTL